MNVPVRESETQTLDPLTDASFTGMDFLPAADKADDYCPVMMPIWYEIKNSGSDKLNPGICGNGPLSSFIETLDVI